MSGERIGTPCKGFLFSKPNFATVSFGNEHLGLNAPEHFGGHEERRNYRHGDFIPGEPHHVQLIPAIGSRLTLSNYTTEPK